jgi:beta-lactamase class A
MMRRRAVVGATLLFIVPAFSPAAAGGMAPGRAAPRSIGSAGVTPAATAAHGTALRAGRVPAADVGAPPGSKPVAPSLSVAPAAVSASATAGPVLPFGTAASYGSLQGAHLHQPIVGMAATPTGNGYWLVAADGGIFTFGDAHFHGSAGNLHLGEPVVGMAATPTGNGYWLVEQSPPDLFSPALVASLNARAGVISASVLDLTTRIAYQYRPGQLALTASIVKVEILGTLLADAQASGRSLNPTEQALATAMIEQSDNGAATTLWDEVGGAPAVQTFDDEVGMTSTTPNVVWGLTTTTAADQVILLQRLAQPNAVLSNASRAYELGLMERVTPSQAWGVSAGVAPGTTVALKNGFEPVGSGATVTSIGWVDGYGRNYLIAVTTSGDPTESYGIDSISEVATAAWDALEH